jgi:uncharacterized membrane-anchored protein
MYLIDAANYQEIYLILTALYLGKAIYYFSRWFQRFRQDTSLSEQDKRFCWKVLTVATIFWPIVLPLSSLEKRIFGSPAEGFFGR